MITSPDKTPAAWLDRVARTSALRRNLAALAFSLSIAVSANAQCVTSSADGAWVNTSFTSQSGTFTATFDATPSTAPTNAVVGLSNGAQTAYASFAALVRFGTAGIIEAYNGTAYAGPATPITYTAGVSYHFRVAVSVGAQTYSVYVTPAGGSELTVGTNFGFRTAATALNNYGDFVAPSASGGIGSLTVCNFSLGAPPPTCSVASVGGAWVNAAFSAQTGSFTATFDATPSAAPTNAVVGLANGSQTAYTSFATLVRFGTAGIIEAYNSTAYAGPATSITYAAGSTYHFRLAVNIASQTYSAYVTPPGGSELTIGTNFGFRAAATSLNDDGVFVAASTSGGAGSLSVCNFGVSTGGPTQVATPTFSPAGGTYSSAQTVSISTTTSGASIRYTTDGSAPTSTTGTLYSGPISVSSTTTLKAIAFESGFTDSTVASATYTINLPQVAAPTFSPGGGTYSSAQSVTISTTTAGATIRYTTDGSTPNPNVGIIYAGPITVSATTTVKAIAYESGFSDSAVSTASYTISTGGQTITSANGFVNLAMGSTQSGSFTASIDAVPSISPSNTTIALCSGAQTSYTNLACIVRFNSSGNIDARNGGAYAAASTIPFSAGVSYHFRFVVSVPTHTYSIYVTPAGGSEITVGSNYAFRTEVNTVASLDTWNVDVAATPGGSVTISNRSVSTIAQVAAPTFSPAGGSYSSAQTVSISTTTSGASIRYTTDGSTPTSTAGTLYSGPITVSATETVKAIGYASGFADSAVSSATYTIGSTTNYTPAQVLAGVQQRMVSSNQVNTKPHINTMTRSMNVNVYQVNSGVFAYTSSMAIDTDGSDPDPDPDHQGQTTWSDNSGKSLGAHHVAYYVLGDYCYDKVSPCPHFYYAEHNIKGLQFALIFYNGKCIGAVFGDTQGDSVTPTSDNDSRELGEASVHAASMLGIPSSGTTGGVTGGVTVVIFSGSSWVIKGSDSTTLNNNAQAVVQKALNTLGSAWGL